MSDLLRFIGAPIPLPWWWTLLAILLVALVAAWCAAVIIWTLPPSRLRTIPIIKSLHSQLIRRHFIHQISRTTQRHRTRALSTAQASAAYSHAVRSFLFVRTGIRAQNLHVVDINDDGRLAKAAPLLSELNDAQFNTDSRVDIAAVGRSAEELIRTWI